MTALTRRDDFSAPAGFAYVGDKINIEPAAGTQPGINQHA